MLNENQCHDDMATSKIGKPADKNNIGNAVDLTGYTYDNLFTAPSDGYVYFSILYNASASDYVNTFVYGNSGVSATNRLVIYLSPHTGHNLSNGLFVKAGMKMFAEKSSAACSSEFFPLE